MHTNSILSCEDTETDGRVDREACRLTGIRSMVCVPLRQGDNPIGVLKVSASRRARDFAVRSECACARHRSGSRDEGTNRARHHSTLLFDRRPANRRPPIEPDGRHRSSHPLRRATRPGSERLVRRGASGRPGSCRRVGGSRGALSHLGDLPPRSRIAVNLGPEAMVDGSNTRTPPSPGTFEMAPLVPRHAHIPPTRTPVKACPTVVR